MFCHYAVRSVLSFAAQLFSRKGFVYVNTPIITGSDEGAVKCLKLLLYHLTERQEPRTEK
jgi:aspartyl/asparaginyl-tRNA synthetase